MKIINYRKNKKTIDWVILIIASALLGLATAYYHYKSLYLSIASESKGNWKVINPIDLKKKSFYFYLVGRSGTLGNESNVITMNTSVDSDGKALRKECEYNVTGKYETVLWWDVVAYDKKSKLLQVRDNMFSSDSINTLSKEMNVKVGGIEKTESWIPLGGLGKYQLQVRLYLDSEKNQTSYLNNFKPPVVKKLKCRGGL